MALLQKNGSGEGERIQAAWAEVPRQAVLAQLERILESPHFRSSKRCSQFLRYVIERASDRRFDSFKERTLGVEVFERDPNYDTNQDPVVRVTAGEVRKRLAQYYLEQGHEGEVRIGMPSGSYIPEVQMPHARPEAARAAGLLVGWRPVAAGLAAALVLAAAILIAIHSRQSALDLFWNPIVASQSGSVLLCVGQPKTYVFNTGVQAEFDRWFDPTLDRRT